MGTLCELFYQQFAHWKLETGQHLDYEDPFGTFKDIGHFYGEMIGNDHRGLSSRGIDEIWVLRGHSGAILRQNRAAALS